MKANIGLNRGKRMSLIPYVKRNKIKLLEVFFMDMTLDGPCFGPTTKHFKKALSECHGIRNLWKVGEKCGKEDKRRISGDGISDRFDYDTLNV